MSEAVAVDPRGPAQVGSVVATSGVVRDGRVIVQLSADETLSGPARPHTDVEVATMCLRASTKKGVNCSAPFFADMKSRPDLLPAAEVAVAYQYRQGEAR